MDSESSCNNGKEVYSNSTWLAVAEKFALGGGSVEVPRSLKKKPINKQNSASTKR